jgi:thiamine biosynthesis protein ThiI
MVDFRPLVQEIQANCPPPLWQVLLKRRMLRAADQVARMTCSAAIVSGEAVGQVSSQTLQNLAVISAATDMPLLRPLIGHDKQEILKLARRVGTHDLSARVPEYCALTPRQPETHARPGRVDKVEARLDADKLKALIEERAIFDLRALDLGKLSAPQLEADAVPEGAVVLDLRSAIAFKSWHFPGALRLDYARALQAYASFDREQTYVAVCEVGLKSAHLAELMHQAGFRAHHFRGGLKRLMRYASGGDQALRAVASPALLAE